MLKTTVKSRKARLRTLVVALSILGACGPSDDGTRQVAATPTEQLELLSTATASDDGSEDAPLFVTSIGAGRTVVLDAASLQLRMLDSAGRVIARGGGKGAGPGEFQSVSQLFPIGIDSIAVWDPTLRRVTAFDGNLRLGAATVLSAWPSTGRLQLIGRLGSGAFVGLSIAEGETSDAEVQQTHDVVTIVSGRLNEAPMPIVRLRGSKQIRVTTSRETWIVPVPGAATARAIAVCGDSIVVVDTVLSAYTGNAVASRPFLIPVDTLSSEARTRLIASTADVSAGPVVQQLLQQALERQTPDPLIRARKALLASASEIWFAGSSGGTFLLERHIGDGVARQRAQFTGAVLPLSLDPRHLFAVRAAGAGAELLTLRRPGAAEFRQLPTSPACGPTFWF